MVALVVVIASCSKPAAPPDGAAPAAKTAAAVPVEKEAPAAKEAAPAVPATASPPVAAAPVAAAPGTWPRFHGLSGYALPEEQGLLKSWPDAGPALVWKATGLGHGYSSVTLADGQIYTAGNIERDGKTQNVVTALGMDGKTRWQTAVGQGWTKDYPGTRSTPTIDGDRIYYETPLGDVGCLEAKSGRKLWEVNILQQFDAENIQWALAESVLVDGPRVVVCPAGKKASVAALDKMTGKTVWTAKSTGDKAGYGSPTLGVYQGLRMIFTMTSKAVIGVNADTGELLWRYGHETAYDVNACNPIFHDGGVFISTGYRAGSVMLKLAVSGGKAAVEKAWDSKELDNQHGGVLLVGDYLYGSTHNIGNGRWVCLDWKTGKRKYFEKGVGKGAVAFADGMLYTLSEKRDVGLAEATPTGHKLVGKFKLPSGGEGPSWAHPVVCGGRLYLRHDDVLFVYNVAAGK
jgi:outer membrane protein assembly factor BamB